MTTIQMIGENDARIQVRQTPSEVFGEIYRAKGALLGVPPFDYILLTTERGKDCVVNVDRIELVW